MGATVVTDFIHAATRLLISLAGRTLTVNILPTNLTIEVNDDDLFHGTLNDRV